MMNNKKHQQPRPSWISRVTRSASTPIKFWVHFFKTAAQAKHKLFYKRCFKTAKAAHEFARTVKTQFQHLSPRSLALELEKLERFVPGISTPSSLKFPTTLRKNRPKKYLSKVRKLFTLASAFSYFLKRNLT